MFIRASSFSRLSVVEFLRCSFYDSSDNLKPFFFSRLLRSGLRRILGAEGFNPSSPLLKKKTLDGLTETVGTIQPEGLGDS